VKTTAAVETATAMITTAIPGMKTTAIAAAPAMPA
jgi:hypothetical protein